MNEYHDITIISAFQGIQRLNTESASGFRNMSSALCISCYLFIRYMCGLPVVSGGLTKVTFYTQVGSENKP